MSDDPKLPEEFAPTGPKLTRFRIHPPPPIKPFLFKEEAKFAAKLAVLAGAAEFAAWVGLFVALDGARAAIAFLALRFLKPLWAWLGTRIPRPAVAAGLIAIAFALFGLSFRAAALLPLSLAVVAVSDLCATCIGDSLTVERRAAAFAWLDMGQALGALLATALVWMKLPFAAFALMPLLALASIPGVLTLHDRGTPRSNWPIAAYLSALRTPMGAQLSAMAFVAGALCLFHGVAPMSTALALLAPLAGMILASRLEPRLPNAILLPRLVTLLALAAAIAGWQPLRLFALGAMFAAIPASVTRGAGEMERPIVSSIAWSALVAGAALGAVLRF
jgi:hypothetical protein